MPAWDEMHALTRFLQAIIGRWVHGMENRRQFFQSTARYFTLVAAFFSPLSLWIRRAFAQTARKLLPADYPKDSLITVDPDTVDARNLDITPLKEFKTMGTIDEVVDPQDWRFKVSGKISSDLSFTYPQIQSLPAIEKKVLMICPGFFVNQGLWKGISISVLLAEVRVAEDARKVVFYGLDGSSPKTESFPLSDVRTDRVFLAYGLNGATLPGKHGFPLRVVAQGYYGDDWLKYVYQMELV